MKFPAQAKTLREVGEFLSVSQEDIQRDIDKEEGKDSPNEEKLEALQEDFDDLGGIIEDLEDITSRLLT